MSKMLYTSLYKDLSSRFTTAQEYVVEVPPMERKTCLDESQFEVVDHSNMGVVDESISHTPMFKIGDHYTLSSVACDGFEAKTKTYELVGIVNKFADVDVDSLIVKQVDGHQGIVYTLSKNDCHFLGVKYEKGLQLLPITLNWKHVDKNAPFDKNDLGTVPLSKIDESIRNILIKIKGFKDYSNGYILTPNETLIEEDDFITSLSVTLKKPLVYGYNGHKGSVFLDEGHSVSYRLVEPNHTIYSNGNFISKENEIFVLLELKHKVSNAPSNDSFIGVQRKYLEGVKPSEMLTISWDSSNEITIDEFQTRKKNEETKRKRFFSDLNSMTNPSQYLNERYECVADVLMRSRLLRSDIVSIIGLLQ